MAIPTDELLQEDFSFPVQGYDIEQIRQSIANRIPLLGSQRGVYGLGIGSGGTNLAGKYIPSYSVATDPTYSSGFQYAQQIAGGMPFSQVVAPGMSFSPERPQGYTQADLNVVNLPRDVAPVFPEVPTTGKVYQPSEPMMPYAPTGTPMPEKFIPSAQKFFPDVLPNFFGQLPQFDFSNIDFSKIEIPKDVTKSLRESLSIPEIDVSQFVTREELPSFVPSFEMPQIPQIDTSQFIGRQELPSLLKDIPLNIPKIDTSQFVSREDISGLRSDILGSLPQIKMPDTSQFLTQQDISGLRSDILGSIPQVQLPDVSQFATQADINKALAALPPVEQLDRQAIIRDIESQLNIPERFDPTALQQQIGGLQQQIAGLPQPQQIDVGALRSDILSQIPQFDPTGLQSQIAANRALLESLPQPEQLDRQALIRDIQSQIKVPERFDPSTLESQISGLQSQIQGIPQFDPSGLQSKISGLQQQIANLPQPQQIDIGALRSDILSQVPTFDPTGLQQRLGGLEQQLASIPQPQQIDINALRQDILSSVPQTNLTGYITESQLQQALQGIPQPSMPDVSQFVTQADIQRAISGIPQVSLSDIEARLAALESMPTPTVPNLPRPIGLFA